MGSDDFKREAAYGTPIPPEITVPDVLETQLGMLWFTDGFPDDATVEKVYDNLDFQRGVQAFLTAMPAASQAAQRRPFPTVRTGQPNRPDYRETREELS